MAPVAPSSPGLFTADSTGHGQAAALNQDGTANSATNPAHVGDVIVLYATGEGQTSPAGIDGQPASAPAPVLPLKVTIGGLPAEVQYKGGVPGFVAGVMQVNAKIPSGVSPGTAVPVLLQVGSTTSQSGATIAVARD